MRQATRRFAGTPTSSSRTGRTGRGAATGRGRGLGPGGTRARRTEGRGGTPARRTGGRGGTPARRTGGATWVKVALIALILYVAGVLVPLGAWVFAVQRHMLASAWSTGNVLFFALAVAAASAMGLLGWIKRLAQRV